MADIGLFEAIDLARSLRRLKPDPVPKSLIARVLDAAICTPSGGNAQNWAFIVVRDPEQRRRLGMIYRKGSDIAKAVYAARGRPPHLSEAQFARMLTAGGHLWEHMGEAPVLLVPCAHQPVVPPRASLPPDIAAHYEDELAYAERIRCEDEVKALLGIPDDVATYALMPISWPIDPFGPLTRRPVAEIAHADRWGNAWPG